MTKTASFDVLDAIYDALEEAHDFIEAEHFPDTYWWLVNECNQLYTARVRACLAWSWMDMFHPPKYWDLGYDAWRARHAYHHAWTTAFAEDDEILRDIDTVYVRPICEERVDLGRSQTATFQSRSTTTAHELRARRAGYRGACWADRVSHEYDDHDCGQPASNHNELGLCDWHYLELTGRSPFG